MFNLILMTTTLSYYAMIFGALKSFSRYSKLRPKYPIPVIVTLLFHSISIYYVQVNQINTYLAFLITLALTYITFYVAFDERPKFLYFGAIHHVFYLYTIRAMLYSFVSVLTATNISELMANGMMSMYILQAAILLSILLFFYLRKEYLSKDNVEVLLRNRDQLRFILFTKTLLGLYVMVLSYGGKFTTNYRWFAFIHFSSAIIANSVAMASMKNGIRVAKIIEYERQTATLKKQLDMQVNQYRSYLEYTKNFREFRHDYKKMLSTVNSLLRRGEHEKAIKILDKISVDMSTKVEAHVQYSNSPIIDAIMQDYANQCKSEHIEFECKLFWDLKMSIDELDIVRIFTNLMSNAFEATNKLKENKYIKINSNANNHWLDIRVQNSFDGIINENLETRKKNHDTHGLGVRIIEDTAEKVGGMYTYEVEGTTFTSYLHLPRQ